MALADYSMVGEIAYYFHKAEDGKKSLVCLDNESTWWVENILHLKPQKDIYSNYTYYLTDEELAMFVLRWQ